MTRYLARAGGDNARAIPIVAGVRRPAHGIEPQPERTALLMSRSSIIGATTAVLLTRVAVDPAPAFASRSRRGGRRAGGPALDSDAP